MTEPDTTSPGESLAVADRLFAAITEGRVDDLRSIYADGAVVWHNFDGIEQTVDENLATLRWVTTNLAGVAYRDIRRDATSTGFVQQHLFCATNRRGDTVEVPACIVCTVEGGRITRLDEYVDSAQVSGVTAR